MKCPKCHFDSPSDSKFCKECGTQLPAADGISVSHTMTLEIPREELITGSTFAGRYQIIEELGKGGMGEVYRALDKKLNEEVALKLIKPEIASDKKTLERFSNELKIARKIVHKNVGRMYHLSEERGTHYISMEYVPGEDLKSLILRVKQLTIETAISLAKQICEGLAEAHRLGVVHRDLKPSNIMIDKEGNARIMDFGIARLPKAKGITGDGVMIGTPEYMSPEQAEAREVDQRSDIYSLGVILYEMVTGRVPFEGETPLSIVMKHRSEIPHDPREVNAQIPEDLSRLILRCLEKDKEKRHQDISELASELTSIERGLPTTERTLFRKEPESKIQKRRKSTFIVLAAGVLIVAIATAGYFFLNWFRPKEMPFTEAARMPEWTNSIAVLPFSDLSPERDQEYFCDGMIEQIITSLTQIPELKVIARTSVMAYRDTQKQIRQIGQELSVKHILTGSIRKSGNRLRISAQLTKTEDGFQVWSEDYDREIEDVFALQDEVSQVIADHLKVRFTAESMNAMKRSRPQSYEAYEYYIKARHYAERNYLVSRKEEDFQTALSLAKKAIASDPDFALGYHALAFIHELHWNVTRDDEDRHRQSEYIQKAYQLDPDSARANAAIGYLYVRKGDIKKAYFHYKKALEINPNGQDVAHLLGLFCSDRGLLHKSIEYFTKAIEFNPLASYSYGNRGWVWMLIGKLDNARKDLQRALELEPKSTFYLSFCSELGLLSNNHEEASRFLTKARSVNPDDPLVRRTQAKFYAALGQKDKALSLEKNAFVYILLRMIDEAIRSIEKELDKDIVHPRYSYLSMMNSSYFDSLRDDPRFKELLEKAKSWYDSNMRQFGDL